jgi:hypothetical protein
MDEIDDWVDGLIAALRGREAAAGGATLMPNAIEDVIKEQTVRFDPERLRSHYARAISKFGQLPSDETLKRASTRLSDLLNRLPSK